MIHTHAIVSPSASLGKDVKIGPFCTVGPEVILGDGVELKSHVVIEGRTKIGSGTVVYPFASIGQPPQILKYKGEKSEVIIGKNNTIREYVTIQAGSADGGMVTKVGDNSLFMVGVHIGHDCIVGNGVVLANYASLAGHVKVGDYAVIGGLAAVHQYVRIGAYSMTGGLSAVVRDLIPFGIASSDRACLDGINLIGMKRREFTSPQITDTKKAVEILFGDKGLMADRIKKVERDFASNKAVQQIIDFMHEDSTRSFCQLKTRST
jgi:UDP-N-acetylglucosamine acyltransferase